MADKTIDDGGAAFAHAIATVDGNGNPLSLGDVERNPIGMSLRDYFAGQAINGICAGLCADTSNGYAPSAFSRVGITDAAKDAYIIADAMIAARKGGA